MKKELIRGAIMTVAVMAILPLTSRAISLNEAYMYDAEGRSYSAPTAYTMTQKLYGENMGTTALEKPQDIYVADGSIYVADTGNNRIVITDETFHVKKIITHGIKNGEPSDLNQPYGVFFGSDKLLYICDTGNLRIIALDEQQRIVREIFGGNLTSVNEKFEFKPQKLVVDRDSSVYAVAPDIYQGILHFGADNCFAGFFAPNQVDATFSVKIANMWKNLFSEKQQDKMEKALPSPYNNVYQGTERFIYTTAGKVPVGDEVKCLNTLGTNILQASQKISGTVVFGDLQTAYENGKEITSNFVDVHADTNGLICALDETRGRLFLYDKECNLVGIFGGKEDYGGTLKEPIAVEKLGERYLVLDMATDSLNVYAPTAYMHDVLDALSDYNAGYYAQSVDKWETVLQQNANYVLAYRSIGRAYLQKGDYEEAMEMLQKGDDQYFYSMALKEFRKVYLRKNLWWLAVVTIGGLTALSMMVKHLRKWMLSEETHRPASASENDRMGA